MRKSAKFALAAAGAAALAGTALAASRSSHQMDVPLPDGSVAHIEYYGEVAPKVTIAPGALATPAIVAPMAMPMPRLGQVERMISDVNRQIATMSTRVTGVPGVSVAEYGNLPQGTHSVSVYTVNNGGRSCTRRTEVTAQGPGKPPKVVTNSRGACGPETAIAPPRAPAPPRASTPPAAAGKGPIKPA